MRQAGLDTIDGLTEHSVHEVALRTSGGPAYDAPRDGPVKWGYPMVGPRFEQSRRRICR
jgi:hypothetical protein